MDKSPAAKSNLKVGDVLLKVGNYSIRSQGDLANASFFAEPNTILDFKSKGGQRIDSSIERNPSSAKT